MGTVLNAHQRLHRNMNRAEKHSGRRLRFNAKALSGKASVAAGINMRDHLVEDVRFLGRVVQQFDSSRFHWRSPRIVFF